MVHVDLVHGPLDEQVVAAVVAAARADQLSPVLIDVLEDPTEPEVARLRAYGRLTSALATVDGRRTERSDGPLRRPAA